MTSDTLIPRPETELLVQAVLDWSALQAVPLRILDVGTGTGAIALALATHLPAAEILACDLSAAALAVARDNAERLDLAARVSFVQSDLLDALTPELDAGGLFDAIVSNPPYVPSTDAATMQTEVVDHEPHLALFAGEDGLEVYRRLIPDAHAALRPGGLAGDGVRFRPARSLGSAARGMARRPLFGRLRRHSPHRPRNPITCTAKTVKTCL